MKTLLKISLAVMITSSALQAAPKWINSPQKNCTLNGGEISTNGVCKANWKDATAICASLEAKLPTIEQLVDVEVNCGASLHDNEDNQAYQSCYKKKGFSSWSYYWSSSPYAADSNLVLRVYFKDGDVYAHSKELSGYFRCVRSGQ
ncbi:MAG: DUF1566 domain-containing protein [Sulfuricurvum sp.]|uniref:Lcl domain-containing protein n=1 Tax=Sulfuricurvum sp. TaxID=2025608 RepID=UPI002638AE19|nr:DUF1566 domain-containing protein [Sulfuricurvum sp.]MDD2830415.1 DUF1566 domain-containing protein [Sulfuricurvum sp.]MDD4948866.1 DUF1566 domain-containing protein [Sulfuricurvum sp.]